MGPKRHTIIFAIIAVAVLAAAMNFPRRGEAASVVVGLVRENCSGYTNCYTSLAAWQAAYGGVNFGNCAQGDLVCANVDAVAEIDGAWSSPDTSPVVIKGWTTDANHTIKIYTAASARHSGKWNDNAYRLSYAGRALEVDVGNVWLDGLQIDGKAAGAQDILSYQSIKISDGIFKGNGTALLLSGTSTTVWDDIIYDSGTGIHYQNGSGAAFYNITVANNTTGFSLSCASIVLKNVLLSANSTDIATGACNDRINATYSATDHAASSPTLPSGTGNRYSQTFSFVNASAGDYHLASYDAGALDRGTNLSTDPILSFTTDIDGQARIQPGDALWDIGADEYVAPAQEASSTDSIPPSVSITAPLPNTTVWGTVTVGANATDNVGVASVQFQVDGTDIGAAQASPPYTTSWNTLQAANGTHEVSVIASDAAGNRTTASVMITVANEPNMCAPNTYYVDYVGGSDNNSGTCSNGAWKHVPGDPNAAGVPARTTLQPGQTVLFRGGVVYRGSFTIGSSGMAGAPITFEGSGWGTGKAVLDGADPVVGGWTKCASQADCGGSPNWQNIYYASAPAGFGPFTGLYENNQFVWTAQDPNIPDPFWFNNNDFYHVISATSTSASITATTLTDPSYLTQSDPNYWNGAYVGIWSVPNVIAYKKVTSYNPSTHTIAFDGSITPYWPGRDDYYSMFNAPGILDRAGEYVADTANQRVYLWPRSAADLSAGGITYAVRSFGIDTGDHSHIVIDGFTVRDYTTTGIYNYETYKGTATGIIVRNNEIADILSFAQSGAVDVGSDNTTIENNYVHENPLSIGILAGNTGVIVRGNTIVRDGRQGIWFMNAHESEIVGNTIHDCYGQHSNGISAYVQSSDILIANNVIYDSNSPITIEQSHNITIMNNVIDGALTPPYSDGYLITDWGGMSGYVNYFNNIAINSDNHSAILFQSTSTANARVENNIIDGGGCNGASCVRTNNIYTGLTWNEDLGHGWSLGPGEIVATNTASIFVDPASHDYKLKAGSPAIDAGVDITPYFPSAVFPTYDPQLDIDGIVRPQGNAWDIGAYEYPSGFVSNPAPATTATTTTTNTTTTTPVYSPSPIVPTSTDTTPPSVVMTYPGNNTVLSGNVTLRATASDNVSVAKVQFQVDGKNIGPSLSAAPYAYVVNAATIPNGNHTIDAVATDRAGNSAISPEVLVTVAHQGPVPSSPSAPTVPATQTSQPLPASSTTLPSVSSGTVAAYEFSRNLSKGSTGYDVLLLQKFLNSQGFQVAGSGAGSQGHETKYFGNLTRTALASFQAAHQIAPALGFFGPITRAVVQPIVDSAPAGYPTEGTTASTLATSSPSASSLMAELAALRAELQRLLDEAASSTH